MKNFLLLAALILSATFCKNTPKQDAEAPPTEAEKPADALPDANGFVRVRGLLMQNQGRTGMMDPTKRKIFEIADSSKTLDSAYVKATMPCRYMSEPVFASLTGKFTGLNKNRIEEFAVFRVDSMLGKTAELVTSVGMTFEFWCYGTNPAWNIEISKREGGIFYQNEGDGTAWFCKWGAPVISGNTWTYNVVEMKDISGPMTIKIKQEKAKDGTSDKEYDYSVEISVKGKKYKGVALRGTAPIEPADGK
jgi:uncharacterized membrane protein